MMNILHATHDSNPLSFKLQYKKPTLSPNVYNNTSLPIDTIKQLPYIGQTVNNRLQRTIDLYATDNDHIISVGTSFDNSMTAIVCDPARAWTAALDAIAQGRIYIYE